MMGLVRYCVCARIPSHAKRVETLLLCFFVIEPYVASGQPCQIVSATVLSLCHAVFLSQHIRAEPL